MSSKVPAIGIDLGTTHCCVAVFANKKIEIIANDAGNRTTPSYVAFSGENVLAGEAAVRNVTKYWSNTIFDVKRLIGRRFRDPKIQEDMKHWPFDVRDNNGYPMIRAFVTEGKKDFHPEEISSIMLSKMRETAEDFLGKPVDSAVITVPAYFNDQQRQATKDAGIIAGLNVLRIINEPTAAGIAYGFLAKAEQEQKVLIFDFGGGTFDVSILSIHEGVLKVMATNGDTHLGGEDINNRLVDHFIEELKDKHNVNFTNEQAKLRLRALCEQAKRDLSNTFEADFEVPIGEKHQYLSISRALFNDLNSELFRKTIDCVKRTLKDANLDKTEIDEIVLVGGSTRIPKIQEMVREFFDGKELSKKINPDEAVAYGAAVLAAVLSGVDSDEFREVILEDVAPLSLGTGVDYDQQMSVIIPRNTPIPTKKTERYQTALDNQTAVDFSVYEGENEFVKDNNLLDHFELCDITPGPAGSEKFDATFSIDEDGILTASAVDIRTGNEKEITIARDGRLSKATIVKMTEEIKRYGSEHQKSKRRQLMKMELESYCISMRRFIKSSKKSDKISAEDKLKILGELVAVFAWLETNPKAEQTEYEDRLVKIKSVCKQIIDKLEPGQDVDYESLLSD